MAEPYYSVGELISKIDEIGNKAGNVSLINGAKESCAAKETAEDITAQENNDASTMSETTDYDMLAIAKDIICELSQKHPMRALIFKSAIIKILNNNAVQLVFKDKYDLSMVKSYDELIKKLISRKLARDVNVNMSVDESITVPEDDIVTKQEPEQPKETFTVVEDLKETAKTAVPLKIENIAKKFSGKAIRKNTQKQNETEEINKSDFNREQSEE